MKLLDAITEEYRKIDNVHLWSDPEKAAARSILRGVVVRSGLYPEFLQALQGRDGAEEETPLQHTAGRPFGGFIRF